MAPFPERLPGTISKLGKGTALQRWQTWGVEVSNVSVIIYPQSSVVLNGTASEDPDGSIRSYAWLIVTTD